MVRSISSKLSLVSAPGFLAKLKERSPSGEKVTNASVVNTDGSVNIPFVSIPAFSNVFKRSFPKASSPTFPRNAVFIPYLFNAARKFPGAPPGFAFIVGYPSASVSFAAKSIRSSPRAITSYIPIPPCTHGATVYRNPPFLSRQLKGGFSLYFYCSFIQTVGLFKSCEFMLTHRYILTSP